MPSNLTPMPKYLIERYHGWRGTRFEENKTWYARLASEGQRPRAMVISCCDSRVDTLAMFGAEPGDLFVVRNVASIVPRYNPDKEHHGTSAAIEYAVNVLRVAHICVVGHSNCGGVAACYDMCSGEAPELDEKTSFIGRWMDILRPAYERIIGLEGDRKQRLTAMEHEGVLTSLANLQTFPFVEEAVGNNLLTLHGAWVDIGNGSLHVYSHTAGGFTPV